MQKQPVASQDKAKAGTSEPTSGEPGKVITDHDIEALEFQSNQKITLIRQRLEAYHQQKIPTDPDQLIKYLLERLKAAEEAITI